MAGAGCRELWECREPFCWSGKASGQQDDWNDREGVIASCRRQSSSPFVSRPVFRALREHEGRPDRRSWQQKVRAD